MKTPNKKKETESTEDFKLRIRQIITGNKPHYVTGASLNGARYIDGMTPEQIEILKLKGML